MIRVVATAVTLAATGTDDEREHAMSTYLLVHGGFTDSAYWGETASALRRDGHRVLLAELPSTGTDPAALGGLTEDAAEVRRLLDEMDAPVVLVGHSYGGMVVTEVADHPAIARTVYLGAFWPERGQTVMESEGVAGVGGFVRPVADGAAMAVTDDWETARRYLYEDVDERVAEDAYGRLMLSSAAGATTPSSAPDRHHPVTYVVLERDIVVETASQELLAQKADNVQRLATSHSPMLADPEGLAKVLARAAG
jgi:pimeloyl-ACP methyl ester carboxylesterase